MELVHEDRFLTLDIEELVPAEWNYKDDDEELSKKLANNLKRNGQIENILVRELETGAYEVVNGNHRYHAMKALKAKRVYCYNLGKISHANAYRIAVETNETKFKTDTIKLGQIVNEIAKEYAIDELELTMPYERKDLDLMADLTKFSWDDYKDESDKDETKGSDSSGNGEPEFEDLKYNIYSSVCHEFERYVRHIKKTCQCNDSEAFAVINSVMGNVEDEALKEHLNNA